jgi:DNA-binding NarL/FixJ family response regulator
MSGALTGPSCLVADDHPAVVFAIRSFLSASGFEIVGSAADGRRTLALAAETRPELALVDFRMPHVSGADLVRRLKNVAPETAIVVYTADADETVANEVIEAGAVALVLKEAPLADLARALESALAGALYLDPGVSVSAPAEALTARELDVLRLLAQGLPNEQIGSELGITSDTVRSHLQKASGRLGAESRTQAVATALRLGLII